MDGRWDAANDVIVDLVGALDDKGLDCVRLESVVAPLTACLDINISVKPKVPLPLPF
jgi:hypothetical protein